MKKIKKTILFSFLAFLTISSFGQNKFGYIDSQELLLLMPDRKNAEIEVQNGGEHAHWIAESQLDPLRWSPVLRRLEKWKFPDFAPIEILKYS